MTSVGDRGSALAHQGARRRSVAGRAAGDDGGARPLLDDRVRLAHVRGETERAAAVHDREIDGVEIHFIHVRSQHEDALPLIMTHGWPGSVIELLETVGPLTDPTAHGGTAEDAFHLVLPSMPGYGFSSEPTGLGWEASRVARAWAELMKRLGYTRYVAQGGDVGALVTDLMGRQAVEGLVGYHLNLLTAVLAIGDDLPRGSEQERAGGRGRRGVQAGRLRLFPRDGNAAADHRLRPPGFTRSPGGVDARPRHGQLLQDVPRVRRRRARGNLTRATSSTTSRCTG